MTTSTITQIRYRLDETSGRTALVEGASAPPRPPETLTVAPGVSAAVGLDGVRGPLYVTAEVPGGRTVRRYDGRDPRSAADCAMELATDRDPRAVWLCERARIRRWWGDGVADLLERRLAAVARRADARLVVWSTEGDVAVGDRYDVVVAP